MALKQTDVDFFRPLWRRVLATAVVVAWFAYETLFTHDQLWIAVTGVAIAYCVWNFFLRYPTDKQDPPGTTGGGTPPAAS